MQEAITGDKYYKLSLTYVDQTKTFQHRVAPRSPQQHTHLPCMGYVCDSTATVERAQLLYSNPPRFHA